jgi:DNA-binding protein H-NS
MKTYQSLKAEIARLEQQAESARKQELKTVIAELKATIAQYGLSAADLGFKRSGSAAGRGSATVGVAKYQDPKSGKTWTGRGKPPAWIAGAKNRDPYLINPGDASAAAGKKAKSARKSTAAAKGKKAAAGKKAAGKGKRARRPVQTPAVRIESGVASQ